MATGDIRFEYLEDSDVHVAYPVFRLATEADCRQWLECYRAYCEPRGGRLDFVFIVEMFSMELALTKTWIKYRDIFVARYVRYGVRVASGADATLERAIRSWGVPEIAPDVMAAIAKIQRWRLEDAASISRPGLYTSRSSRRP